MKSPRYYTLYTLWTAQWRKACEGSCKNNLWYNLLDHVQKETYFFLQERLLWIKAFSSMFGRSEAARLCTASSIGRYHFVSQQEFKIKAIHELNTNVSFLLFIHFSLQTIYWGTYKISSSQIYMPIYFGLMNIHTAGTLTVHYTCSIHPRR